MWVSSWHSWAQDSAPCHCTQRKCQVLATSCKALYSPRCLSCCSCPQFTSFRSHHHFWALNAKTTFPVTRMPLPSTVSLLPLRPLTKCYLIREIFPEQSKDIPHPCHSVPNPALFFFLPLWSLMDLPHYCWTISLIKLGTLFLFTAVFPTVHNSGRHISDTQKPSV